MFSGGGNGRSDVLVEGLLGGRDGIFVQGVGKRHQDFVFLTANRDAGIQIVPAIGNPGEQVRIDAHEFRVHQGIAQLNRKHLQELLLTDEVVGHQDFPQLAALRVLALDLEGVFQGLGADIAQFHQQAADAHGKVILADGRLDLLVGDERELF